MKLLCQLTVSAALVTACNAHHTFAHLIVNGEKTPAWKYVREVEPPDTNFNRIDFSVLGWPYTGPLDHPNITCGRAAFLAAARTLTADIIAGQQIGFEVGFDPEKHTVIGHPGPASIWLTRTPVDDLTTFHGQEAEWVRVGLVHVAQDPTTGWWDGPLPNAVTYTLPATTPPGKYLLRIDHIWPGGDFMEPQFYTNCAHVNVIGPGGGSFEGYPFAKFPGTYVDDGPGTLGLRSYLGPDYKEAGPPLWQG